MRFVEFIGYNCDPGEVWLLHDVTNRIQAEEALRQERNFAESLIETAQAIVLVLDCGGRIVRFNPFMEELSGYTLNEAAGKDWFELFVPEASRDEARAALLRSVRASSRLASGTNNSNQSLPAASFRV